MRKILYSPYYGSGWTSWNDTEIAKIMIDWPPLVDAVEKKEKITQNHPALVSMIEEIHKQVGEKYVCVLSAIYGDLEVAEIPDGVKVRINEYDGLESIEFAGEYQEWL